MENLVVGWLVLHTEGCDSKTYELKIGKNRIGRKTSSNCPEIFVEDDKFVSRNHAVLVVRITQNFEYEYLIADNETVQGKPSTNGTYINGNSERIGNESVKLKDGDTIQVGVTKFVLQTAKFAFDSDSAVKLTARLDYAKTVDVNTNGAVLKKRVN